MILQKSGPKGLKYFLNGPRIKNIAHPCVRQSSLKTVLMSDVVLPECHVLFKWTLMQYKLIKKQFFLYAQTVSGNKPL